MAKKQTKKPPRRRFKNETPEEYAAAMARGPVKWPFAKGGRFYTPPAPAQPKLPALPKQAAIKPAKTPEFKLHVINDPSEYAKALRLGKITEKQIRVEYTRLRKIMKGRLQTFEKYGLTEAQFYTHNKRRNYPSQSQLKEFGELFGALAYLTSQLYRNDATYSGYLLRKKKQGDWLKLVYGIDLDTPEKWKEFSDFMNYARSVGNEKMRYSEELLYIIGREGIEKIYDEWKQQRFDPLNPPDAYLRLSGRSGQDTATA